METDNKLKLPVIFNPSKPVAAIILVILVLSVMVACSAFCMKSINVFTFLGLFTGLIFIAFGVNQRLGIRWTIKNSLLYKGEVISCTPNNIVRKSSVPDSYIIEFSFMTFDGTRKTAKWHFKEPRRVGEFTDIYINSYTGEIAEKSAIDKARKQCGKCTDLIIGVAGIVLAVVSESLDSEMSDELLKTKLSAIPVIALLSMGGVYLIRTYFRTKNEMEMTPYPIVGTVVEYVKRSTKSAFIPSEAYFPNISYWDNGEKIFECPSTYSRSKYPVGSKINLYRDESGRIYEAKSILGTLPTGIMSLIIASVMFVLAYIVL